MGVDLAGDVRAYVLHEDLGEGNIVQLRVRLDGLGRVASAGEVAEGMRAQEPCEWESLPTANGTYLQITSAGRTLDTIDGLLKWLTARGRNGFVTVNASDLWPLVSRMQRDQPTPATAVLAFSLTPTYPDTSLNAFDITDRRWGVSPTVTKSLADALASWAVDGSDRAVTTNLGIEITTEDARDVIEFGLLNPRPQFGVLGEYRSTGSLRSMSSYVFGQMKLCDLRPDLPTLESTIDLLNRSIIPRAADLDYAAIRLVPTTSTMLWYTLGNAEVIWDLSRPLWREYVAEPCGIQLLTDAHLEKATDLSSNWTTERVSPGRWLVQARDLNAWFTDVDHNEALFARRYVSAEVFAQALADFGHMIISRASAGLR